ncbi:MAG: pyrroline-5-carboxylate reductase [Filifactoraceae bacterium]
MNIGFIGCGNMAKAMIGGIINSNLISADNIIASDDYLPTLESAKTIYNINISQDNKEVATKGDVIFLSIKPNMYEKVIREISSVVDENTIIVTIAPGKTIEHIESLFNKKVKILRTMPNTPALVGAGITAICPNDYITEEELSKLIKIIETFSLVEKIDEYLFDAVVSVSGSSPAYVFMFIEAMADAGVLQGLPRDKAYRFAAQAVLGSAKLLMDTGKHPGELKDMVCSPGGTTIEAVAKLEEKGFRSAIMEAMKVCGEKSSKM